MKKREIVIAFCGIILGCAFGLLLAFVIVENNIPSNASNDGWLGFLGGMLGATISGLTSLYILYINRKDAEETQKENKDLTLKIQQDDYKNVQAVQEQNNYQFEYQFKIKLTDDITEYIAELIKLGTDRYLHIAGNTAHCYGEHENRAYELCEIIGIKLYNVLIEEAVELNRGATNYFNDIFTIYPYQIKENKKEFMDTANETLRKYTKDFINSYLANRNSF